MESFQVACINSGSGDGNCPAFRRFSMVVRIFVSVCVLAATGCASTSGRDTPYFTSAGNGPTIVFVHGWTCDLSVWSDQLAAFDDDYRVIALDLPGHGRSPAPEDGVYTMNLFADAVESVRANAGAGNIVLVGHSMGVSVIRQYALRYPQNVAGLVAVDGGLPLPVQGEPEPEPLPPEGTPWRAQMIESMFVPATSEDLREQIREMMLRGSDEQALAIAMSMRDPVRWASEAVEAPMLAVMASTREMPDPALYEQAIPRLELVQLPGTGHFLMMEEPEQFNTLMRGFLDEIDF